MAKTDNCALALALKEAIGVPITVPDPTLRSQPTDEGHDIFIEFLGTTANNQAYLFQVWAEANRILIFQVAPHEFKVLSPGTADHILGVPYFQSEIRRA